MVACVLRSIRSRWKEILFQLAILVISFWLIDENLLYAIGYQHYASQNREIYQYDSAASGVIETQLVGVNLHEYANIYRSFWERMQDKVHLRRFGAYYSGTVDFEGESIPALFIAGDLWDMVDLKMAGGNIEETAGWKGTMDQEVPILVGHSLGKRYHVGDRLQLVGLDSFHARVAGILENKSVWLAASMVFDTPSLMQLDEAFLIPLDVSSCSDFHVTNLFASRNVVYEAESPETFAGLFLDTDSLMTELSLLGANEKISEKMKTMERRMQTAFGGYQMFAHLVSLIVFVYMAVSYAVQAGRRKGEMKILRLQGFSRRTILVGILCENIIPLTVGGAVTYLLREGKVYTFPTDMWRVLLLVHHTQIAGYYIMILIILMGTLSVSAWLIGFRDERKRK